MVSPEIAATLGGFLATFLAVLTSMRSMNRIEDRLNKRIDERFQAIDHRITDTRDLLRAEFRRVEEVLDARVKHLEEDRRQG